MRAVSSEPSLLAHISSESRGTFRQKARSLAPLNGWACAVEICHDEMLEGTNSLDGAHINFKSNLNSKLSTITLAVSKRRLQNNCRCYIKKLRMILTMRKCVHGDENTHCPRIVENLQPFWLKVSDSTKNVPVFFFLSICM